MAFLLPIISIAAEGLFDLAMFTTEFSSVSNLVGATETIGLLADTTPIITSGGKLLLNNSVKNSINKVIIESGKNISKNVLQKIEKKVVKDAFFTSIKKFFSKLILKYGIAKILSVITVIIGSIISIIYIVKYIINMRSSKTKKEKIDFNNKLEKYTSLIKLKTSIKCVEFINILKKKNN